MRNRPAAIGMALLALAFLVSANAVGRTEDPEEMVRKAVQRCTLNQAGTHPFHLKATLAPSYAKDRESNRTGEVEYWWASPTQWKREVRSPEFHQVMIVSGGKEWQKNEGDYFPEWLREIAVALIQPVPDLGEVLQRVEEADTISVRGTLHLSWMIMGSDGNVEKGIGAGLSIDGAGLLQSGSGLGWGGWYKDYKTFHNRTVARTVSGGTPEVTAKVATLEDVGDAAPNLFDAPAEEGDSSLLRTIVVGEIALRKNLAPAEPVTWPALQDGPLQGVATTEVVVDRSGKVRQLGSIISDNPGLSEAAGRAIGSMQFTPYLQDGVAVQVVSTITIPFKTARPPGVEAFDSARSYFERGRKIGFPAAGDGPSYVLHATFQARLERGVVEGRYVDTWKSDREWRREATVGDSRLVRARHGDNRYLIAEGPDAGWLRLVLKAIEPIPDLENFTFVEADWRIKREIVDGVNAIRVLAGYESPEGVLDPEQARGYWFDDAGRLLKTFAHDLETRRRDFKEFGESQVAREIQVLRNGSPGLLIRVTDMSPAGTLAEDMFELHGHEWKKAFTDEAR